VSKRLTAIDWPVECAGSVGTEPGKWCRVDAEKILQDLTVNEGREKLEKKAGKLLDKLFNRD
jgi:AsmA protein